MSARSSSSESQGSNSHESESTRPNRWAGPPSTWQTLTAQERGLATSLDALRDKDLGVHLYNAHAWKKRVESEGGIVCFSRPDFSCGALANWWWHRTRKTKMPRNHSSLQRAGQRGHSLQTEYRETKNKLERRIPMRHLHLGGGRQNDRVRCWRIYCLDYR